MSTKHEHIFQELMRPFSGDEVKTRAGSRGAQLSYISWAQAANRLDTVVGPESWEFSIQPWGERALIGTLTVTLPDGTKVSKSNVGGCPEMPARDDEVKGAASDCFKRCCAMMGVGRHLCQDGLPDFVPDAPAPSRGPASAPPSRPANGQPQRQAPQGNGNGGGYGAPKTGGQLFAWANKTKEDRGVEMVKHIDNWAKLQGGFPYKWKEWSEQQVSAAYAEGQRQLGGGPPGSDGDEDEADGIPFSPAPSDAPDGGAHPTPPAGADDPWAADKETLYGYARDIAKMQAGDRTISKEDVRRVLRSLHVIAPVGTPRVESFAALADPKVLFAYLRTAELQRKRMVDNMRERESAPA